MEENNNKKASPIRDKDKTNESLKAKSKLVKKAPRSNRKRGRRAEKRKRESNLSEFVVKTSKKEEKQQNNASNEKHTEKIREKADESEKKKQKNENKHDGIERSQTEKNEKLGGLIFMCSGKTKPDCFRYNVMGVSMGRKDVVLSVKPGLKLFLYDFELQLLYGVFQASSSGGLKLEPKAFGGAFPVQVRFSIHKDCYPVPEKLFKMAIKENYDDNRKFKIELTFNQVRKLMELFRPATIPSAVQPVLSPLQALVHDKEGRGGVREARNHSGKDTFANGNPRHRESLYDKGGSKNRNVYGKVESKQIDEKTQSNLFLSEKEYRTYGLRGGRKEHSPVDSILRRYETDNFQRPLDPVDLIRRDMGPTYSAERAYDNYDVGPRLELYSRDPHVSRHYGVPSANPCFVRREEKIPGSYSIGGGRTETAYRTDSDRFGGERVYLGYATEPLSEYNQRNQFQGVNPDAVPAPVSSRYTFAGPSMTFKL
ncbi:hypothetical protein ACFE04_027199 [Oxalis oulophora]